MLRRARNRRLRLEKAGKGKREKWQRGLCFDCHILLAVSGRMFRERKDGNGSTVSDTALDGFLRRDGSGKGSGIRIGGALNRW